MLNSILGIDPSFKLPAGIAIANRPYSSGYSSAFIPVLPGARSMVVYAVGGGGGGGGSGSLAGGGGGGTGIWKGPASDVFIHDVANASINGTQGLDGTATIVKASSSSGAELCAGLGGKAGSGSIGGLGGGFRGMYGFTGGRGGSPTTDGEPSGGRRGGLRGFYSDGYSTYPSGGGGASFLGTGMKSDDYFGYGYRPSMGFGGPGYYPGGPGGVVVLYFEQ